MSDSFDGEKLALLAKGGDVQAMYRLATLLGAEGHSEMAMTWLKKAASNGHSDARFTLANFYLKGINLDRNLPQAVAILESAVKDWHMPSVQLYAALLGQGLGVDRNWHQALDLLILSAARGFSPAMVELAFLLLLCPDMPKPLKQVPHQLMQAAACRKNLHAGLYLAATMTDESDLIDAKIAGFWVARAAEMGHPKAAGLIHLADENTAGTEPAPEWIDIPNLDSTALKSQLDALMVWTPDQAETLFDRPRVKRVEAAVPAPVCDYMMGLSMPRLQPATEFNPDVGDAGEWVAHSQLTGHVTSFWGEDHNLVSYIVADRLAKAASSSHDFAEALTVYVIPKGGRYLPHVNFVDPSEAGASEQLARYGQSPYTVQLILQTAVEGGYSQFGLGIDEMDCQSGDMVIINNCLPDGEVDDQAAMAESPVEEGEKWVAQRLIREKLVDL